MLKPILKEKGNVVRDIKGDVQIILRIENKKYNDIRIGKRSSIKWIIKYVQ